MAVKFKSLTKHGAIQFIPKVSLGFEDSNVEKYMIAAGWADPTDEEPLHVYGADEVIIDPENTKHNDSGLHMADIMKHGTIELAEAAGVKPRSPEPAQELKVQDVVSPAPVPELGS